MLLGMQAVLRASRSRRSAQMSLEVKVDQMAMLEALKEYLKKVDLMDQGIVTTLIPTAHVAQALKSFFPNKSIVRLKEIVVRSPMRLCC